MSPIKVGFVGLSSTGWASFALAPSMLRPTLASSYTLTALSTTSVISASESAKRHSNIVGHLVKPFHGDTSSIANDPDVDFVAVAVRPTEHKAALLPVIAAGKSFFVEWPAGNGLEESMEIAEAAKMKGLRTMVGLQGRYAPVVKKVGDILESGVIGKVLSSSVIALGYRELMAWGPLIRRPFTVDITAGATMLSIGMGHQLDTLTHLLGDFSSVSATTTLHYPVATLLDSENKATDKTTSATAPDQVAFTGLLKSGAISTVVWRGGIASTKGRRQFLWEIDGENGSIRIESDAAGAAFIHIRNPKLYLNGELVDVQQTSGPGDNIAAAWTEFAKGDEGIYATMDDAVRNHRLLDAITRSAKEGRVVKLD